MNKALLVNREARWVGLGVEEDSGRCSKEKSPCDSGSAESAYKQGQAGNRSLLCRDSEQMRYRPQGRMRSGPFLQEDKAMRKYID